jgi:4-aminobutyrate aminotransferase-like enzyme
VHIRSGYAWRRRARDFRTPFRAQLNPHVRHVPFPPAIDNGVGERARDAAARALEAVDAALAAPSGDDLGAVLVEPIQGRGGIVVPHPSFLPGLREICTRRDRLLIVDEILTGLGRTGRWFARRRTWCQSVVRRQGLGGSLPLSAASARRP